MQYPFFQSDDRVDTTSFYIRQNIYVHTSIFFLNEKKMVKPLGTHCSALIYESHDILLEFLGLICDLTVFNKTILG